MAKTVARSTPRDSSFGLFQSTHPSPFKNAAASTIPGYEAHTESPSFLPNRESHVTVPLLRSLITGTFFGVATGFGVIYFSLLGRASAWYSIEFGAMAGSMVFFGASFFYWLHITGKYDGLLSRVETVTGLDINQDGEIGKPEPRQVRVHVEEKARWEFEDLPGDDRKLYEFARDIASGRVTFSERGAADSGYGIEEFRRLRDVFIKRHWAEWKDPANRQQGVMLYRAGQTIIRHIAENPPEPEADTGLMTGHHLYGDGKDQWN